jgi:hypothetical protein
MWKTCVSVCVRREGGGRNHCHLSNTCRICLINTLAHFLIFAHRVLIAPSLQIGPSHSGLSITAYPGEHAIISGGVQLELQFTPARVNDGSGAVKALVAILPDDVVLPDRQWTELFVADGNSNQLNLGGLSRYVFFFFL